MLINEREYKLGYTGATLVYYKQEFKRDLLLDLANFEKEFDSVTVFQIMWAMIKTAEINVPSFMEWISSVNIMDLLSKETMEEVRNVIAENQGTKELKKK